MRCELTELPIAVDQAEAIMASVFALAVASKSKRRATDAMMIQFIDGFPMIKSSGVNGTVPGSSNVCETPDLLTTLPHVIHAEANCLDRLNDYNSLVTDQDILFCTDSPCPDCLRQLTDEGVKTVVYAREYRLTDHLDASDIRMFCLDLKAVEQRMIRSIERMSEVISATPSV